MAGTTAPSLLLIEPDAETAFLVREAMQEHFGVDCVTHCSTAKQALGVDISRFDLVLADLNLPDNHGLEVLDKLLESKPDLPVVIVTGQSVLDSAMQAIRHGAYDYVVKAGDYLFALPLIVEKNLAIWKTKQDNLRLQLQLTHTIEEVRIKNKQLEEAVRQLETMAATDPLTGLANRRAFNQAMERSFSACSRYGHDLACVMIDVDGFKPYNDTYGHQDGDKMLQRVARVLEANCRRSDVAGRYGGDEFVLLLPETDVTTARLVAKRIADEFENSASVHRVGEPKSIKLSMSMGLACLRHSHPANPDQLVAHADHALYRAKQAGKTRIMVYSPTPGTPGTPGSAAGSAAGATPASGSAIGNIAPASNAAGTNIPGSAVSGSGPALAMATPEVAGNAAGLPMLASATGTVRKIALLDSAKVPEHSPSALSPPSTRREHHPEADRSEYRA